jgi:acyl carrier protein
VEGETGMDNQEMRLERCFLEVFPELAVDEIAQATSTSVQGWDSVSTVTLLTVVEEEFGVNVDISDVARFDSFKRILAYLQTVEKVGSDIREGENVSRK